jgi:2-amino-4-hydroxy-6-hydroxymethyldihydropteridine diphosphokinase
MTTPVWIGLGSNLGDRKGILDAAVAALADAPGVTVKAVSSYHETQPVGGPPGQGPFLNAAARLETTLEARQLLAALQAVERQAGRVRAVRWGERTLDLDILIFGTKFLDTKHLKLPHPRLALRRFVLAPLAEIAPTIVDTATMRTIADLLANLDTIPGRLALHGPPGPTKSVVLRRLVEELRADAIREADLIPDRAPPDDRPGRHFTLTDLLRMLEVLGQEPWRGDTVTSRWVMADYYPGLDLCQPSSIERTLSDNLRDPRSGQTVMDRILESAQRARPPTFAVILPGAVANRRRPGFPIPLLWPDSTDPHAIVEEILATCRAIEGA